MSWNNLNTKKQSIALTVPVYGYEELTGKRLERQFEKSCLFLMTVLLHS